MLAQRGDGARPEPCSARAECLFAVQASRHEGRKPDLRCGRETAEPKSWELIFSGVDYRAQLCTAAMQFRAAAHHFCFNDCFGAGQSNDRLIRPAEHPTVSRHLRTH